jgi:nucleoid-associated protein YgaU
MFGSALDSERAFGTMRDVARTRVRRRRILTVGACAVAAGLLLAPAVHASGDAREPLGASDRRYVVRSGDTLWSIASRVAPGRDPRPLVDDIVEANGVDAGAIVPGQTLTIPSVG